MARYLTTVRSPWPVKKAFDEIADFTTVVEWDPGVAEVVRIEGTAPAVGTVYQVKVSGATLEYRTIEYVSNKRTALEAKTKLWKSYDVITFKAHATGGCLVTYNASFRGHGVAILANPVLERMFPRAADAAAKGLARKLQGEIVERRVG